MANEAQGVADEPEGHFSLRRDQMKAIARRSNYLFCKSKQPKPGPSSPPHPRSSLSVSLFGILHRTLFLYQVKSNSYISSSAPWKHRDMYD